MLPFIFWYVDMIYVLFINLFFFFLLSKFWSGWHNTEIHKNLILPAGRCFRSVIYTPLYFPLSSSSFSSIFLSDTQVCEIVQLAAVCGERIFNVYMLPTCAINPKASEITGFTVSGGFLYRNGVVVPTVSLFDALKSFVTFLHSLQRPLLLAAHYARGFDIPILTRVMNQHNLLQPLRMVVSQYLDTLELSRALYPELPRHSLQYLVEVFLKRQHDAHNAVEDARFLQALIQYMSPSKFNTSQFIYEL